MRKIDMIVEDGFNKLFLEKYGVDTNSAKRNSKLNESVTKGGLSEAWYDYMSHYDKDPEVIEEANEIAMNFDPVVLDKQCDEEGCSILIGDQNSDFTAWVDVWNTGEEVDWNQYIFSLLDRGDCIQKLVQEDASVADAAFSLALDAATMNESLTEDFDDNDCEVIDTYHDLSHTFDVVRDKWSNYYIFCRDKQLGGSFNCSYDAYDYLRNNYKLLNESLHESFKKIKDANLPSDDEQQRRKGLTESRNNYGNKGPWWYFTLHGVGPGTIPKDLHVLKTQEGKNEKGTNGTFVQLDGVLTADELKQFDMKELSPDVAKSKRQQNGINESSNPKNVIWVKKADDGKWVQWGGTDKDTVDDGFLDRINHPNYPNKEYNIENQYTNVKVVKNGEELREAKSSEVSRFYYTAGDNTYVFYCSSRKTRNGFAHDCTMELRGDVVSSAKAFYINRTWEMFQYQSVMLSAVDKANISQEDKDILKAKIHKSDKDVDEFSKYESMDEHPITEKDRFNQLRKLYPRQRIFKDKEKQSGELKDFLDDLKHQNRKYEIYDNKKNCGCTVFFESRKSMNESGFFTAEGEQFIKDAKELGLIDFYDPYTGNFTFTKEEYEANGDLINQWKNKHPEYVALLGKVLDTDNWMPIQLDEDGIDVVYLCDKANLDDSITQGNYNIFLEELNSTGIKESFDGCSFGYEIYHDGNFLNEDDGFDSEDDAYDAAIDDIEYRIAYDQGYEDCTLDDFDIEIKGSCNESLPDDIKDKKKPFKVINESLSSNPTVIGNIDKVIKYILIKSKQFIDCPEFEEFDERNQAIFLHVVDDVYIKYAILDPVSDTSLISHASLAQGEKFKNSLSGTISVYANGNLDIYDIEQINNYSKQAYLSVLKNAVKFYTQNYYNLEVKRPITALSLNLINRITDGGKIIEADKAFGKVVYEGDVKTFENHTLPLIKKEFQPISENRYFIELGRNQRRINITLTPINDKIRLTTDYYFTESNNLRESSKDRVGYYSKYKVTLEDGENGEVYAMDETQALERAEKLYNKRVTNVVIDESLKKIKCNNNRK